ncbi:MAG: hypothetical protein ACR2H1_08870 [Limisphaerales bacterium]
MPSQHDSSDFEDSEFQSAQKSHYTHVPADFHRPPTREEVESKMSETQLKLSELKRTQEELEQERAALEETRRRQIEFQTGREEMLQHLTRGVGLLEETEFAARRDAEQMAKSLANLEDALRKVQAIDEAGWTQENFTTELTRALTTIENARMEWNGARLKFPVLSGAALREDKPALSPQELFASLTPGQLVKFGIALTWPLLLLSLGIIALLLLRY